LKLNAKFQELGNWNDSIIGFDFSTASIEKMAQLKSHKAPTG